MYLDMENMDILEGVDDITQQSWQLWLRSQMPASLKGRQHSFLSIEYWKWVGLFLAILLGLIIDHTLRLFLRASIGKFIKKQGATENVELIRFTVRPIGLVIAAIVWIKLLKLLNLPPGAANVLIGAARIFGIFAGTWGAWRLADLAGVVLVEKAKHTDTKFDDVLIPLVRKTVKIFILVIALIYAAAALSIQLMPLLASLGIGGVAFAFAAKDTVENFFGSLAVLLDRPFEVGDWVVIGSDEGTVEEIGFRSTRIRTFYNTQITVPNSNLVRAVVDNYGRREYRRWKAHVGVQYDTTPQQLIAFIEGIRELVRCHPYTRKDYFNVFLNQFADSSLNILVYVFWKVPDWPTELRERERLMIDIVRLADQLGVQFAFPTQTLHLYKEEQAPYQQQHQPPQPATDSDATTDGIRAAQHIIAQQSWQQQRPDKVEYHEGPTAIEGNAESSD
jgi:MscS family membrane protein